MKARRFSLDRSGSNPWRFTSAFRAYRRTRPGVKIGRADQVKAYGTLMGREALVRQWIGSGEAPLYLLSTARA